MTQNRATQKLNFKSHPKNAESLWENWIDVRNQLIDFETFYLLHEPHQSILSKWSNQVVLPKSALCSVWPDLAKFRLLGNFSMFVMGTYWKILYPFGHTVCSSLLIFPVETQITQHICSIDNIKYLVLLSKTFYMSMRSGLPQQAVFNWTAWGWIKF